MTYLKNALSHIANEERTGSHRSRLTQLQKNRIALKYIKFRENQNIRSGNSLLTSTAFKGGRVVEVSGGYDRAIERYGEHSVIEGLQQKPIERIAIQEQSKIRGIVESQHDYIKNPRYIEAARSNEFIRTKSKQTPQFRPYSISRG